MSLFLPNIPQPGDNLDFSQGQLLSNNSGLDTVFGIEHYKFSDATANKGFHNTVTTPVIIGGTDPTTDATHCTLFSKVVGSSATIAPGQLQFSKGPTPLNEIASPVTFLQAPAGGTAVGVFPATVNILDFTGVPAGIIYVTGFVAGTAAKNTAASIYWDGVNISGGAVGNTFSILSSGTFVQLQFRNGGGSGKIIWTIQFYRLAL